MLTFQTGVPGAGKTAFTIWNVKKKAEAEGREVFYAGIPEVSLPWASLNVGVQVFGYWTYDVEGRAVWNPTEEAREVKGVENWMHLPPGAIIVIDECQDYFRNRSRSSAVPFYVSELEKHRHRGHDLYLITQKPGLVDPAVKDLAGKHIHIVRPWGRRKVRVFEWEGAKEITKANFRDALESSFSYPPEVFTWYKSTTQDTHKTKLPLRVRALPAIFALGVALMGAAAWKIYGWSHGAQPGASTAPVAKNDVPLVPDSKHAMTKAEYVENWTPRVADLAYSAPVYDTVTQPVVAPLPVACVAGESRCQCYSQQGTRLAVSDKVCRQFVETGFFNSFKGPEPMPGAASAARTGGERPDLVPVKGAA